MKGICLFLSSRKSPRPSNNVCQQVITSPSDTVVRLTNWCGQATLEQTGKQQAAGKIQTTRSRDGTTPPIPPSAVIHSHIDIFSLIEIGSIQFLSPVHNCIWAHLAPLITTPHRRHKYDKSQWNPGVKPGIEWTWHACLSQRFNICVKWGLPALHCGNFQTEILLASPSLFSLPSLHR